jgi:hypothetical protein
MNNPQRDPHRAQPQVLQVPEFPRLVCAGEDILERAQGIHQTYAEVLRSLVGDVAEVPNWKEWAARQPDDDGNQANHSHIPEIDSPK